MTGPVLPPGWIEARDPNTGQIYYANPTTKESSWEIPRSISHITHQPQHQPQYQHQHQHQHQQNHNDCSSQRHPSTTASIVANDDEKEDGNSLITVARELTIQQAAAAAANTNHHAPQNNNPQHLLELSSITCGQLVDLIQIQKQQKNNDEKAVYTPINPYNLPDHNPSSSVISDATIDSKLDILFTQLEEFGYQKR